MVASHLLFVSLLVHIGHGFLSSHSPSRGNYTINSWSLMWKVPTGRMLNVNYDISGIRVALKLHGFQPSGKFEGDCKKGMRISGSQ